MLPNSTYAVLYLHLLVFVFKLKPLHSFTALIMLISFWKCSFQLAIKDTVFTRIKALLSIFLEAILAGPLFEVGSYSRWASNILGAMKDIQNARIKKIPLKDLKFWAQFIGQIYCLFVGKGLLFEEAFIFLVR